MVDTSYFFTESRWNSYLRAKDKAEKFGTVGAAALDKYGNLAAGTSTGGMTYKMKGRVGDSPIIGAGTYADNNTCAVSATGHGEYFIRNVVAYDISALMKYRNMSLQQATDEVIMRKLKAIGGDGGVIAVDKDGHISMTFNTAGMYRGFVTSEGEKKVLIYQDK
jgi:beta-aspartyl-peptidase (threonine type)